MKARILVKSGWMKLDVFVLVQAHTITLVCIIATKKTNVFLKERWLIIILIPTIYNPIIGAIFQMVIFMRYSS